MKRLAYMTLLAGLVVGLGATGCGQKPWAGAAPATPATLTGPATPCKGATGLVYTCEARPDAGWDNATPYLWTLPAGFTITAGDKTNSITVSVSATAVSGNISVVAQNQFTPNNAAKTMAVVVNDVPAAPAAPTTADPLCAGATINVSVTPPAGASATGYVWTIPSDATINGASNGPSVAVVLGTDGSTDITVTASNACTGTSPDSAGLVLGTLGTAPATPSAITGPSTFCVAQTGIVYSVTNDPTATSYTWTLPGTATITAGATTNSITVTWAGGVAGNITAKANNACGTSTASTLAVTVAAAAPPIPAAITQTPVGALTTTQVGVVYAVTNDPNASGYTWDLTALGVAGTAYTVTAGAGTNSITVTFMAPVTAGGINVKANNCFGSSAITGNYNVGFKPGIADGWVGAPVVVGNNWKMTGVLASGTAQDQLNTPNQITVDTNGNFYVADKVNNRISKFSRAGAPLGWLGNGTNVYNVGASGAASFAANGFSGPCGVAYDTTGGGTLFVADTANSRLCKWTAVDGAAPVSPGCVHSGGNTFTLATAGTAGVSTATAMNLPLSVAVDGANVYVADTVNNRIQRWVYAGAANPGCIQSATVSWAACPLAAGGVGGANGTFSAPAGVFAVPLGTWAGLYIANTGYHRIEKWALSGALPVAGQYGSFGNGVAAGTYVTTGGVSTSNALLNFNTPTGLWVDPLTGNKWIADSLNHRISYWTESAAYSNANPTVLGNGANGYTATVFAAAANITVNGFSTPKSVALDPSSGYMYVGDSGNNRVTRWGY